MSQDGFAVDLDALRAARDRVGRLAEEVGGPPREVPSVEVFGHDRLAGAVQEFAARERRGLAQLGREVESIHRGLAETIDAYKRVDEDGAAGFEDIAR